MHPAAAPKTSVSNLGISQLNAWPYVLSQALSVSMGTMVTAVFVLFVLIQILILRRDFRPVNLLQIIASILFGAFVNLCNSLVAQIPLPDFYPVRLLCSIVSVVVMAVGVVLYLTANIVPLSSEGVVLAVQQKTGKPFSSLKLGFDILLVILALLSSRIFLRKWFVGVREGTVLAAVCLGPLIGMFSRLLRPGVQRFCFGISSPDHTPATDAQPD